MFDRRRPDPAQGVFETMLILDGRPIELEAHLARLDASLTALFPDRAIPDLEGVPGVRGPYGCLSPGTSGSTRVGGTGASSLRIAVAPNGDGELEVQIDQRQVSRGAFVPNRGNKAPGGVALRSLPLAGGLGGHKWIDRSLLDEAQAGLQDDSLPLVVDADGTVLEASRANVFAVRGGALLTPPTDGRILPGITRAHVLEIATTAGFATDETVLSHDDLLAADEVFLTGSIRGIERVRALDGTELAANSEVGAELGAALRWTWAGAAQVG